MNANKRELTTEELIKALRCRASADEDLGCNAWPTCCSVECPFYMDDNIFNLGVDDAIINTTEKLCKVAADKIETQEKEIKHLKATLKAAESDIRELLLRGLRGHEVPACVYCAVEDANDCDEHGCINIARWRGTKEEPDGNSIQHP